MINVLRSFIWCTDFFCVFLTHVSLSNLCLTYLDVGAFVNFCWQVNHHCPTAPTALWKLIYSLPSSFTSCFTNIFASFFSFCFWFAGRVATHVGCAFPRPQTCSLGQEFLIHWTFSFIHPLSWKKKYLLWINFDILAFMAVRNSIFAILCPIGALCSNLSYIYSGFLFTFLLTFIRSFESLIMFLEKKNHTHNIPLALLVALLKAISILIPQKCYCCLSLFLEGMADL